MTRWHSGEVPVRRTVDAVWGDPQDPRQSLLRDNPRRRLLRIRDEAVGDLLVKQFRTGSGRHRQRERFKSGFGMSPACREWRVLSQLHAAGVAVPEPLGLATLAGGDRLLVMRFIEGPLLRAAYENAPKSRAETLCRLGSEIAALHAVGFTHGDLHDGNILISERGPVLLDLQHAARDAGRASQVWDLGCLDYALSQFASRTDRLRLRAAALGLERPFDPAEREALKRVGRASAARGDEHARSRTRRALRPGRRFARVDGPFGRGLRQREFSAEALHEVLSRHEQALAQGGEEVLKRDGRSAITSLEAAARQVVVKEVLPRSVGRMLADLLRGSAGYRAWRGGHGLAARRIGAADPLAFVERRRFGIPVGSWVVLRDLRPALPADRMTHDAPAVIDALWALARSLHLRGVDHGDLKASHVYLQAQGSSLEPFLLDLEGVRFRRRLSDADRIRSLAQLNASLPDAFPDSLRCRGFHRYADRLRFRVGEARALGQVVRTSLARNHRWTGGDCKLGESRGD